ncbi:hypothetical protein J8C06_13880 [Chloracidobacterium validum]|uniref:Uncharacterized protein n=1 Tax=Chloracidobacterium validum TaxID=2821543 RepID=A0ABX8BDN3_9BACT|nr:hypothetical protein [Chloracidobacterium validum]QUW04131.1 hypothetical protein J8C06_13880 [Chloracidobacterium validum]
MDLATWDGDAFATVAIESRGYAGRNDMHVFSEAFTDFCASLIALQRTLKEEARLTGVMPDELDIVLAPADTLGHIAVKGPGHHVQMAHTSFGTWCILGFKSSQGSSTLQQGSSTLQ